MDGKRGMKLLDEKGEVLENGGFQNIITEYLGIFLIRLGGFPSSPFFPSRIGFFPGTAFFVFWLLGGSRGCGKLLIRELMIM